MAKTRVHVAFGDPRVPIRLWNKTSAQPNGCWKWGGNTRDGYGLTSVGRNSSRGVHRMFYELLVGPAGEMLDHVCHTNDATCTGGIQCEHRRCVNPAHLEPVTARENTLRSPHTIAAHNAAKSECDHGHPFDDANTRIARGYERVCRACHRERVRRSRARRRADG